MQRYSGRLLHAESTDFVTSRLRAIFCILLPDVSEY